MLENDCVVCSSHYEYRHVVLPANIAAHLPPGRLLSEQEWRQLGVQQSRGACSIISWPIQPSMRSDMQPDGRVTSAERMCRKGVCARWCHLHGVYHSPWIGYYCNPREKRDH